MNTIFIVDYRGEKDIEFFNLNGDYSYLNNIFINGCDTDGTEDSLELELIELLKLPMLSTFPTNLVTPETKVIVVGFLS